MVILNGNAFIVVTGHIAIGIVDVVGAALIDFFEAFAIIGGIGDRF